MPWQSGGSVSVLAETAWQQFALAFQHRIGCCGDEGGIDVLEIPQSIKVHRAGLHGIGAARSQALEMSRRRLRLQAAENLFFADQETGGTLIRCHEKRGGHTEVRK